MSTAVTVKVRVPTVVVSIVAELPVHEAMPEPASAQVNKGVTTEPRLYVMAAGVVMVIVGGLRSTLYGPYGPAPTALPATSLTVADDVDAAPFAVPAATDVASANEAGDPAGRPEPPSSAVHGTLTLALYHGAVGGGVQPTVGAFRSILKANGPAVAQLPARSHNCAVPVSAEAVSVPAGTVVDNVNDDPDAIPETASVAPHVTV